MALTGNVELRRTIGDFHDLAVAASVHIYAGAVISVAADGYAKPYAGTDTLFAGIAEEEVDNSAGAAGAKRAKIRRGIHYRTVAAVTGASGVADIGTAVYASDDGTFTLTVGTNLPVGKIADFIAGEGFLLKLETDL